MRDLLGFFPCFSYCLLAVLALKHINIICSIDFTFKFCLFVPFLILFIFVAISVLLSYLILIAVNLFICFSIVIHVSASYMTWGLLLSNILVLLSGIVMKLYCINAVIPFFSRFSEYFLFSVPFSNSIVPRYLNSCTCCRFPFPNSILCDCFYFPSSIVYSCMCIFNFFFLGLLLTFPYSFERFALQQLVSSLISYGLIFIIASSSRQLLLSVWLMTNTRSKKIPG